MTLAKRNYKKENKQPINKFIKAAKVRLISSSGEQLGIKSIDDALNIASKENLDLSLFCQGFSSPDFAKISAAVLRIFLVRSRAPETKI